MPARTQIVKARFKRFQLERRILSEIRLEAFMYSGKKKKKRSTFCLCPEILSGAKFKGMYQYLKEIPM
jgi:hypothetical protein